MPLLVLGALLLGFALWAIWLVVRTTADLGAAADDANRLQQAISAGDDVAADAALVDLKEHAASAADRTDGWTWSALTHTPWFGDDLAGVRTVSAVLDDLARSGIDPLVQTSEQLDALRPQNGRIDIAAVETLQRPVADGVSAFEHARSELAEHDPDGFVAPLGSKYRDIAEEVDRAADILATADRAVRVLPSLLGRDAPRAYLLVVQTNAEVRGGGGLPGSVSLVTADDGAIEMTRQVSGNSFGRAPEPVLPLSEAEQEIWDNQLGTFFLDANFTPDFPRSAELWRARWEEQYETLDGVFAIDPVTLSYVLEATGGVDVAGGPPLGASNAVDELLHEVYLRWMLPGEQDDYFESAARAIFEEVTAGQGDSREVIAALARGTDEGRVRAHSFHAAEQEVLAGTAIAGELDPGTDAPAQVGVYLNDTTGAKMSFFLRHEVEVSATSCSEGVQDLAGRATLHSAASADAASLPDYVTGGGVYGVEPGAQLVAVHLVGPVGGTITDVRADGEPALTPPSVELGERPVVTVAALLEPGGSTQIEWTMTTGPDQGGEVVVTTTPGVEPTDLGSVAASAC